MTLLVAGIMLAAAAVFVLWPLVVSPPPARADAETTEPAQKRP